MHIVYLSPCSGSGGAERVLSDAIAGVCREHPSWRVTLCAPAAGPLVTRARDRAASVSIVPMPAALAAAGDYAPRLPALLAAVPGALGYARDLRRTLRELRPDIVHSNGFKMHVLGAWMKPAHVRLVWHLHDYVSRRRRSAAILRGSVGRTDLVVANSESVAADARREMRASTAVRVVPNGVDLTRFSPAGSAADLDEAAGLRRAQAGIVRVGLVATYARWKGHVTFLRAVAALLPALALRAYVVGGPIYTTSGSQTSRAELNAEAARLGLGDRVGFIDFVDEPETVYRALDVVVHASIEPEPFGLVIAEAMACGRAVVAARDGGVPEVLAEGTGIMHRPGDVAGLAAAIATLVKNAPLRATLGAAARASAVEQLGHDRFARRLCDVYSELDGGAMTERAQQVPA